MIIFSMYGQWKNSVWSLFQAIHDATLYLAELGVAPKRAGSNDYNWQLSVTKDKQTSLFSDD